MRDATALSERIKKVDKEAKMDAICRLMSDYIISMGDLIAYYNEKGSVVKETSVRLAEINQIRKAARKRREGQLLGLKRAREAQKQKRETLINSVPQYSEISVKPESPEIVVNND